MPKKYIYIFVASLFLMSLGLTAKADVLCDGTLTIDPGTGPMCADTAQLIGGSYVECSNTAVKTTESICVDKVFIDQVVNTGALFSRNFLKGLTIDVSNVLFKISGAKWIYLSAAPGAKINNANLNIILIADRYSYSFVDFRETDIGGKDVNLLYVPGANSIQGSGSKIFNAANRNIIVNKSAYLNAGHVNADQERVVYGYVYIADAPGTVDIMSDGSIKGGAIYNQPDQSPLRKETGSAGDIDLGGLSIQTGDLQAGGYQGDGGDITISGEKIIVGNINVGSTWGWVDINPGGAADWRFVGGVFRTGGRLKVQRNLNNEFVDSFKGSNILAQAEHPQSVSIKAVERVYTNSITTDSGCSVKMYDKVDYPSYITTETRDFCGAFYYAGDVHLEGNGVGLNNGVWVDGQINASANSNSNSVWVPSDMPDSYKTPRGAGGAGRVSLESANGIVYLNGDIYSVGFHAHPDPGAPGFNAPAAEINGNSVYIDGNITTDNFDAGAFLNEILISPGPIGAGKGTGAGKVSIKANGNPALGKGWIAYVDGYIWAKGRYPFSPDGGDVTIQAADFFYADNNHFEIDTSASDYSNSPAGPLPTLPSGLTMPWFVIAGVTDQECDASTEIVNGTDAGVDQAGFSIGYSDPIDGHFISFGDGPKGGKGGNITITASRIDRVNPNGQYLTLVADGGDGTFGGTGGQGKYCMEYVSDMRDPASITNTNISNVLPKAGRGGNGGNGGNGGDVDINISDRSCFKDLDIQAAGGTQGGRSDAKNYYGLFPFWQFGGLGSGGWAARTGYEYEFWRFNFPAGSVPPLVWQLKHSDELQGWQNAVIPEAFPPRADGEAGNGGTVSIHAPQPVDAPNQYPIDWVTINSSGGGGFGGGSGDSNQVAPYPFYCTSNKSKAGAVTTAGNVNNCLKSIDDKYALCRGHEAGVPNPGDPAIGCYSAPEPMQASCFDGCWRQSAKAKGQCLFVTNPAVEPNSGANDTLPFPNPLIGDFFLNNTNGISGNRNCNDITSDGSDGIHDLAWMKENCRSHIVQTPCQNTGFTVNEGQYFGGPNWPTDDFVVDPADVGVNFNVAQARNGAFSGTDGNTGGNGGDITIDSFLANDWMTFIARGGSGSGGTQGQYSFIEQPGSGGDGGNAGDAGRVVTTRPCPWSCSTDGGTGGMGGQSGKIVQMNIISAGAEVGLPFPGPGSLPSNASFCEKNINGDWYYNYGHFSATCNPPTVTFNCCDAGRGKSSINAPHANSTPYEYKLSVNRNASPGGTSGLTGNNTIPITNNGIAVPSLIDPANPALGRYICVSRAIPIIPPWVWTESNCCDAVDNDLDGLPDCQDPDCNADCYTNNTAKGYLIQNGAQTMVPGAEVMNPICQVNICQDLHDNDNDVPIDLADPTNCQFCGNGVVDIGEQCDGGAPWNGAMADNQCAAINPGQTCVLPGQANACRCQAGIPNLPPNVILFPPQQVGGCFAHPVVRFTWNYVDLDGDQQESYRLEVINAIGDTIWEVIDNIDPIDNTKDLILPTYGEQYTWRVRVTDKRGGQSGFQDGNPSQPRRWPRPGFKCNDKSCGTIEFVLNANIKFCSIPGANCPAPALTSCYDASNNPAVCSFWKWDFDFVNGVMDNDSTEWNPSHQYTDPLVYKVRLEVTDGEGKTCAVVQDVPVGISPILPPKWIEIQPF